MKVILLYNFSGVSAVLNSNHTLNQCCQKVLLDNKSRTVMTGTLTVLMSTSGKYPCPSPTPLEILIKLDTFL